MYAEFFQFQREPFSIAPDPRYLFMSERHREALAHLLYGVGSGGFVLLTGEIGAGKTTICRCFLEQIPDNCRVAYIFNPKLTVTELLAAICEEFGLALPAQQESAAGIKRYVDALNAYLLSSHAEGRNNVLIIDEAQNLSAEVLEQLRLLTNLETNECKLLQILLIGQPELQAMLERPELRQLAQRIIARYHLGPLAQEETAGYIRHRLAVSGMIDGQPFQPRIMRRIHRLAQGIPRRINLICDRSLLGAYVEGKRAVDRRILAKAAAEVSGTERTPRRDGSRSLRYAVAAAIGAAVIGVGAWSVYAGYVPAGYVPALPNAREWMAAWWKPVPLQTHAGKVSMKGAESATKNAAETSRSDSSAAESNAPKGVKAALQSAAPDALQAKAKDSAANAKTETEEQKRTTPAADIVFGDIGKEEGVYRRLAQLWGAALPQQGETCKLLRGIGLHCYQSRGGLDELRRLDRPAILKLYDDEGAAHAVLLTGLSMSGATLDLDGKAQTVSLSALGRRFRGEFTTIWRAPAEFRDQVRSGERGPEIDWIAAQLARQDGLPVPEAERGFDAAMAKRVREFQALRGLEKDGVVGPKTFMYLNRVAGIDEPQLSARAALGSRPAGE